MISLRELFLEQIGQTSELPMLLEVSSAEGVFIMNREGKRFFDMNSGISVSSLGHRHHEVTNAIIDQVQLYTHTMVYGEHIQSPQVSFATRLLEQLGEKFEAVYYLTAGTEAVELGMKLSKKVTNRYEIISCKNAYHGSTQGAESLRSDITYKSSYLPLLPGVKHIEFNNLNDLDKITCRTAGVICEVVQGEAGVIIPQGSFLKELSDRCKAVGALLIFDEIQSGFGRTGHLFAHQKYNVEPDVLLIGKAMGGGMPISGVVSSKQIMNTLVKNPALGHITTFGGHPVSCAAADASLEVLLREPYIGQVHMKEQYIKKTLSAHTIIKEVRSSGLMMAVEPVKRKYLKHIVAQAFELGVIVDWFLFNNRSFRLAPPLIITMEELEQACSLLLQAMDYAKDQYS